MKKAILCLLTVAMILSGCLFSLAEAPAETGGDYGKLPTEGGRGGRSAAPLTYEDLGIKVPEDQKVNAYLNPRTYVLTKDNENSSHTHTPDGDIDVYLFAEDSRAPIEVRFDLDKLPGRDAFICIYAYDCDEFNGNTPEYDAIYVNNTKIGAMTGQDDEWNTTYWSVPVSALKVGANYVTIHIGRVDKTQTPWKYEEYYPNWWAIRVQWIQLLLDGGSGVDKPEKFSVNLRNASLQGSTIYCEAGVEIESTKSRDYEVEYSLVDRTSSASETYMQIISTDAKLVSGKKVSTYGTLKLPLSSPKGQYSVQVMLRDRNTKEILATDEKFFDFDGSVPSFDITNLKAVLSEEDYTPGPITMKVSADITNPSAIKDVKFWLDGKKSVKAKIDSKGHATGSFQITKNGVYEVEIRYVKGGKTLNSKIYVTVANITGPSSTKGDINGDGKINDADCKLLREYLMGVTKLTSDELSRADMDEDGSVTVTDYAMLRQAVLGQ